MNQTNPNNTNNASFDYCTFADWLTTLSPFEFVTLGTIIGYIISCNLTISQQNSIGNWFELVGQIILTFNAQGALQHSRLISQDEYNKLVQDIENLKQTTGTL